MCKYVGEVEKKKDNNDRKRIIVSGPHFEKKAITRIVKRQRKKREHREADKGKLVKS